MCSIKWFVSTECKDYKFTETMDDYEQMKGACEALDGNGKIASEDLKDRLLANLLKYH